MPSTRRALRTTSVTAQSAVVMDEPGRGMRPRKKVKVEKEDAAYAEAIGTHPLLRCTSPNS